MKDTMKDRFALLSTVSGLIACLIGLAYLNLAGAPLTMILVNGGAMIIGLLLAFTIRFSLRTTESFLTILTVVCSLILFATAVFGYAISDARRWILIGPFFVQTSSILLPLVAISFARVQNPWTTLAVIVAALAMAAQPDRAMAGMLCLATLVVGWMRASKWTAGAAVICTMTFAATLLLPDNLTAVPYVDHIIWTAFEINLVVGLALWFGCLLIVSPIVFLSKSERTTGHYVFTSCWFALITAAAMGAYPTPLIGYGSSAIIGYFLSLTLVRTKHELSATTEPKNLGGTEKKDSQFKVSKMSAVGV